MYKKNLKLNKIISRRSYYQKTILVTFGVFAVAMVFLAVQSSTVGSKLSYLEEDEEKLLQENRELSQKLSSQSSLTSISSKAEEMGFASPQNIIYPSKEGPVANVQ